METTGTADAQAAQRQVRLQLTTREPDLALPEGTGPILVPTGSYFLFFVPAFVYFNF